MRARSPLSRRVLAVSAATALIAAAGLATAAPAQAGGRDSASRSYVALGDSYASGEGLAPYAQLAGGGDDPCHRSLDQSYPERLSDYGPRAFDRLTSAACSGAVTTQVLVGQTAALTSRTRTVTLTVGGNDIGFAQVLASCVYTPVTTPPLNQLPNGRGCRAADPLVDAAIDGLAGRSTPTQGRVSLATVIAGIAAKSPKAEILVSGYPQLFGAPASSSADCQVSSTLPIYISAADVTWIREETKALNAAIRTGVRQAKKAGADVRYVDPTRTFRGGGVCDTGKQLINGLVLNPGTLTPNPASFHPNADGQLAYAEAFVRAGRGR